MEEFGVGPDVITFSTIMNAWSAAGFMDKCRDIFDDMVKARIQPDAHVYSILAKGYVQGGEPEKAEEILNAMIKSGFCPNVVIFTTVINGWCSAGRMEYSIKIFQKMCECGIAPNLKTFETLIWGYGKARQPWKSEEMLQIMEEFNVQPKKTTLLAVAEAWSATGLKKEANRILSAMKNEEMTHKTYREDEIPAASLDRHYQKPGDIFPNNIQLPNLVISDQKGSGSAAKRSRMVLRDTDFSLESSWTGTRSLSLSHSCTFGARSPIICQKQSPGQLGTYGHLAHSYQLVFLN